MQPGDALIMPPQTSYYRVDQFAKEDTGDTIQEVIWVGAAISLMDDVWWGSTIIDPVSGNVLFAMIERA